MPRSSRDEEFSAFVQTRRSGLVRSACLLTAGDTHLAEDLVQTALARLYVAWPRVRKAGTESGYVWRIIVNAHIDEVRRPGRRRERHVPELPEAPAPPEAATDGPGGGEVRAALAALPPGMRAAVVLRHWLDLGVGETAELLNCSEGTVKSQTAKATARPARPAQPGRRGKDPSVNPVNDVKDLLELALRDGPAPASGQPCDPAADLARGRRLLRRRRSRLAGLAAVAAVVLGVALVPLALNGPGTATGRTAVATASSSRPQPSQARPHSVAPEPQSRQIKLVAWKGTQPPGYRVSWMPKGWVVQGSTPLALVIAPPDAPDKNPDVYIGKLVVMLQSRDATAPPADWASQPVNGRPGKFDVQGDTQILAFQIAGGQWVVIQAPVSLGWDSAELAKFAGGVQVLAAAQQGRG